MASIHDHTEAFIAAVATATSKAVGDHHAPDGSPPYSAVYLIGGPPPDGPIAAPQVDFTFTWQLNCVGAGPEQARGLMDRAMALRDTYLTVTGRSVGPLQVVVTPHVSRDDDVAPALYTCSADFEAVSTPA